MMNIYYGKIVCNKIQTKNWTKLHHIPMKLKPKTCAPWGMAEVVQLHIGNQYVSKRSKKKREKAHSKTCFKPDYNIVATYICEGLGLAKENRQDNKSCT
mgnify:FL=1